MHQTSHPAEVNQPESTSTMQPNRCIMPNQMACSMAVSLSAAIHVPNIGVAASCIRRHIDTLCCPKGSFCGLFDRPGSLVLQMMSS